MIPNSLPIDETLTTEGYEYPPDKTYRLDFVNKRIIGTVEGKDAVLQFIKKVLSTDKYAYAIYDWYYGNELLSLVGKPYEYIIVECPRIINEALTVDSRILDVTDFEFSQVSIDSLTVSCVVKTIYGDINYTQEVMI